MSLHKQKEVRSYAFESVLSSELNIFADANLTLGSNLNFDAQLAVCCTFSSTSQRAFIELT